MIHVTDGPDKVMGLKYATRVLDSMRFYASYPPGIVWIPEAAPAEQFLNGDLRDKVDSWTKRHTIIARPCPMQPRHGFVPSRIVRSGDEVVALAKEVIAEESGAWIMLNLFCQSSYSAVMTRSMMAISLGHDGATSGKRTVTLPISLKFPDAIEGRCLEIVGDVERQGAAIIVQAKRIEGHANDVATQDYIQESLVVAEVLHPDKYSDLEWEKITKKLRPIVGKSLAPHGYPKYKVAYMPGASLLCHKALWCITRGIPVVTTDEPTVGTVLHPTSSRVIYIAPSAVRPLLHYGFNEVFNTDFDMRDIALAALHCVHQYHRLATTFDGMCVVVYGLAALAKLMLAACMAEARYVEKALYVDGDPGLADLPWIAALPDKLGIVIRRLLCKELFLGDGTKSIVQRTAEVFKRFRWKVSGYGGEAWHAIAEETTALIFCLLDGNIEQAVDSANKLIHMEHNSSVVLNKYFGSKAWDVLSDVALGKLSVTLEALPGFAALCQPILTNTVGEHSISGSSILHSLDHGILDGYHDCGTGPVISYQAVAVRNGYLSEAVKKTLLCGFCWGTSLVEQGAISIKRTLLDKHGIAKGSRDCRVEPSDAVDSDAVWSLIEVAADNPLAYHMDSEIGIVIDGKWYGYRYGVYGNVAYHLVGRASVYNIPVVMATPGACDERYTPGRMVSDECYLQAIKLGFGLQFDSIEALTAYPAAFDIMARAYDAQTWLDGIARGMMLRYLLALMLWIERVHRGEDNLGDTSLAEVLDVSTGPPGVSMVSPEVLFGRAMLYERTPAELAERVKTSPHSIAYLRPNHEAMEWASTWLRELRTRGAITTGRGSEFAASLGRVLESDFLSRRVFWDPYIGDLRVFDARRARFAQEKSSDEYVRLHPRDFAHGLVMIREALRRQEERGVGQK